MKILEDGTQYFFLARAMCKSLDVAEVELVVCEEQLNNGL